MGSIMTHDMGYLFQTFLDFCLVLFRGLLAFRHESHCPLVLVTVVLCGCPTSPGSALLLEIADSQELRRQSTKLLSILIRREKNLPSPCGWLLRKLLLFLRPHAEKGAWAILPMRPPSMV